MAGNNRSPRMAGNNRSPRASCNDPSPRRERGLGDKKALSGRHSCDADADGNEII
ncbi:hypothetical protein CRG98_046887 [Punica granatum]|uniref:Uncharacterized protein n=1 Tax=Punica granatum TaxID=22663 RepID=A0A2I0HMA8_PUNGR|nr:hypothetical protein CRG98_046887 [Punica granatum]